MDVYFVLEETLVQMKKQKLVSFILVIIVFFSGMCFENVKTDSLFVYVSAEKTDSYIMSCEAAIMDYIQRYTEDCHAKK